MGTLIRHAGLRPPAPIVALTISVIEFSLGTLLMAQVCRAPLLVARLDATAIAAVLMAAVTMPANPEYSTAMFCPAKSLTQNNFNCCFHPRPKARLDKRCQ